MVLTVALMSCAVVARADVFNMTGGQTSLQFVTVGNPGNAADLATGYGSRRPATGDLIVRHFRFCFSIFERG
jgi:hypothetical protein